MSYDEVKQASYKKVGTKQTLRWVEQGKATRVFVAQDADSKMTSKIVSLCSKSGVPITYVDSMEKLGRACGIEVGAATVAFLKD